MIGFLRSAFSTTLFRPFTGQPAVRAVEAARGMKVRSSVKLMCDGCNFVRRRGRLQMDLEPGRPVFLDELVQQPQLHTGKTVRVTGTLHAYSPVTDRAELVDGQYLLIVDTQLLGVQQYHVGQTYQLIGEIDSVADQAPESLFDDAKFSLEIVLRARVGKSVDGLDMAVYKKSVHAVRKFLDT
ncbi:hypothetical protein GGH12_000917 [Coemansia sp. RSA 1822]|nr:hypothetical protein LPJ76_000461 [Coemansia sp. RSA 638]KAJ2566366.1 hypothetical protein GGH12_000917 [Coemansia sp. RSA 1822]